MMWTEWTEREEKQDSKSSLDKDVANGEVESFGLGIGAGSQTLTDKEILRAAEVETQSLGASRLSTLYPREFARRYLG